MRSNNFYESADSEKCLKQDIKDATMRELLQLDESFTIEKNRLFHSYLSFIKDCQNKRFIDFCTFQEEIEKFKFHCLHCSFEGRQ